MQVDVITLFPDMLNAVTEFGVTGRAVKKGALTVNRCNPRDYTTDNYRTVDDRPYGGGPGMVMMVEPLQKAVQDLKAKSAGAAKTIYLSPQGKPLNQAMVETLAAESHLILIAGRYEGIDERFIEMEVDQEVSLGDYVLSGGELGAMVVIDAVARLLPGVLGHVLSAEQDSFVAGLLDCPHYTRPEEYQGRAVPPVLLSGDHKKIAQWRLQQALGRTWQRRPDLLTERELTEQEAALLEQFQQAHQTKLD